MITYDRPLLYPKQESAFFGPTRFSVCEGTTKSGKTAGGMAWLVEGALIGGKPGRNYWWVAPTYEQAGIAYQRFLRGLPGEVITHKVGSFPQRIELANGAILSFRSADNDDSLYGDDVYRVLFDEFTRAKEAAWAALLSVTTATNGLIRLVGNVVGRGVWGYRVARKAEQGAPDWHYTKLSCIDAVAGFRAIGLTAVADRLQASVDTARRELTASDFAMLYMADAPEDETNPISAARLAQRTTVASERPTVCFGLDLARAQDWTELVGFDDQGQWTTHWRTHGGDWATIKQQIKDRIGTSIPCVADSTGAGDAVVEDLSVAGCNIVGFKYSKQSRRQLLSRMVTALHSGPFTMPEGVRVQLEQLQVTYDASGPDYRIAEPMHDDGMMAFALGIRCFDDTVGVPVAPASVVAVHPDKDTMTFRIPSQDRPEFAESFGGLGAGW